MSQDLKPTLTPLPTVPKELIEVVRAGVVANHEVPGSVALGGTVCSMYAGHRISQDIDFGVSDLRNRFQEVRERLLELDGWKEARAQVPRLILGSLNGVEIGFRQLRRNTPVDTLTVTTDAGLLVVPTYNEMLVTKAFLLSERNYTRDYVDFAELAALSTVPAVVEALAQIDIKFAWEKQPSVLLNVLKSILAAEPADRDTHGFDTFRWLSPRLKSWEDVRQKCSDVGAALSRRALEEKP